MKTLPIVFLGALAFWSCTSKSSQSGDIVVDSLHKDTTVMMNEQTIDDAELATAQNLMERFQHEFNETSIAMPQIRFEEENDTEARSTTYYYSGQELSFISEGWGAEGGFGYRELTWLKPGREMVLRLGVDEPSSFICSIGNEMHLFTIEKAQTKPTIIGRSIDKIVFPDYKSGYGMMMSDIKSKLNDFTKSDGWGTYYLSHDTIESTFGGRVAVYKRYRVDLRLWDSEIFKND